MKTWKTQPRDSFVAKYVDCYWFLQKVSADCSPDFPKLNPDPAAHFIIAKPQQSYRYEIDSTSFSGVGSHLMLPHCKTLLIDHRQPFLIVGIKFHVGALYALRFPKTGIELDKILGLECDAIQKINTAIGNDFLEQAIELAEKSIDPLDKHLQLWLLSNHEDKHSKLVRHALQIDAGVAISAMGEALHCSQRTLERSFTRVTGLTLKQYQSMNRLEAILSHVYQQDAQQINWVDIAAEFGFSDQPHLIRYLKKTIGSTPGHYAKQRDLTIDAYGNFE